MPQFELSANRFGSHPFYKLDDFAKGYVEAMFFTNGDTGDDDEFSLNNLGVERLTKASVKSIAADCNAFLSHVMPDGCFIRQWLDRVSDYDDEQAGADFWFTRQGHGVGFWCRDVLEVDMYAPTSDESAHDHTLGGWIVAEDSAGRMEGFPSKGQIGDLLSDAAHSFGETYVSANRGWIHA